MQPPLGGVCRRARHPGCYFTVTAVCGIGIGLALFAARGPMGRLLRSGLEH
ncbi:MAG: hypothetical protein ACRDP3_01935 [Streptomyces sp.]